MARKFSFEMNKKDIVVRLTTQTDPVLGEYRLSIVSKTKQAENLSSQDKIVEALLLCREDNDQGCKDCIMEKLT